MPDSRGRSPITTPGTAASTIETSTLLQNCASGSDRFFLLTKADEIVTTFATIGTNLKKLRLAK
jgi:hypothetical protein